jgi:hypothetical protein
VWVEWWGPKGWPRFSAQHKHALTCRGLSLNTSMHELSLYSTCRGPGACPPLPPQRALTARVHRDVCPFTPECVPRCACPQVALQECGDNSRQWAQLGAQGQVQIPAAPQQAQKP